MEQNVQIVRGIFEASSKMDKEAIIASLDDMVPLIFTEDVEFVETPERVDARTFRGHGGVKEAFTRWLEQWNEYSAELEQAEARGKTVLAIVTEQASGEGSGAPVTSRLYIVFEFRDGRISRYRETYDEDAARAMLEDGS